LLRSFRSRLILTIVISALLAVGLGLAIPAYARTRAEEALSARLGPGAHVIIGAVHLGILTTTIDDVVTSSDGLDAHFARVSLRASIYGLATSGAGAIHEVTVEDGRVIGDLAQLSHRTSEGGPSSEGEHESRTITIHDVGVLLRDGDDELGRIDALHASWDGTTLRAIAEGVGVGQDTVDRVEIDATRIDGTLRATRVSLAHVVVSADAAVGEGPIARIRSALRRDDDSSADAEAAPRSLADRFASIEARLDPTFQATVDDLTVRRTIDGLPHDVVASLRASLRRTSDAGYTTVGQGEPEGGGTLAWDLDVRPHTPTASGTVTFDRVALAAFVPLLPSSIPFSEPEHAHVSGHLVLTSASPDAIHAEGTLALEDLALAHHRIAQEPVRHIAFALHGAADITPSADRITVSSLGLTMGGAQASLGGTIEWASDHYLFDGRVSLPRTACEDAVHAIPRDLLGDTASFHFTGDIAASLTARIDSRDLPGTTLQIHVADGCTFTSWPAMADTARFTHEFDHEVQEPDGTTFRMTTGPGTEAWTPITEISPFLVHAVLAHEDSSFFVHSGFAPWAIREALIRDLTAGRYVAGGSTITMQLTKNVFLHREKTLARKIQEVLLTWWLETRMEKQQILELYLNVIEYGPDVYGIRHAAEHYFGRSPADLSPAESAYLALILPNPPRFHEQWVAGEIPRAFRNRIANFVRVCGTRGRYDAAAVAYGVAEAETLTFHHEGDPPPAPRTTEGAVASIPQIQFFSTVPLARLAAESDAADTGDDGYDTTDVSDGAWEEETWP
jgi:hypothetical protein